MSVLAAGASLSYLTLAFKGINAGDGIELGSKYFEASQDRDAPKTSGKQNFFGRITATCLLEAFCFFLPNHLGKASLFL